jgi:hypothetical protein
MAHLQGNTGTLKKGYPKDREGERKKRGNN